MSTKPHVPGKVRAALSIVFLLPPLIFFMMWISIGLRYSDMNSSEKSDTFLGYFGGLFENLYVINLISIICCMVAIILASRSFKKHLLSIRVLMLITVLFAIFLIMFDIFQLL
jgi:type IV secretory pathway TrbL component